MEAQAPQAFPSVEPLKTETASIDSPTESINSPTESKEDTFADQVNTTVASMTKVKGKWKIPDDTVSEELKTAAISERRFRDTQSAFHDSRKKVKALESINDKITTHMIENATAHLTIAQHEELDELKLQNPDAWREKLNEHEAGAKKILQSKVQEFTKESKEVSESELRLIQLEEFRDKSGLNITDEVIENELPPKYLRELKSGKLTFQDFLVQAGEFLTKGGAIKDSDSNPTNPTNLTRLPGTSYPSSKARAGDILQTYKNAIL